MRVTKYITFRELKNPPTQSFKAHPKSNLTMLASNFEQAKYKL